MDHDPATLLRHAAALLEQGRDVALCLLTKARGSTPQSAGALMLVDDAATISGTIGGGCVEAEVRRRAMEFLTDQRTGLSSFKLDHDYGWDDGLICGGTVHVAIAPWRDCAQLCRIADDIDARRPTSLPIDVHDDEAGHDVRFVLDLPVRQRLLIAGAGHVGQATARLGVRLGFDVTLFDDRQDLLKKYAPEGTSFVSGDIAEQLEASVVDDSTFIVIVTRGHRHDEQALHASVGRGAAYVGMIGSRRKVKLTFDDLIERGVDRAALDVVHAPIGLDIGSVTVEEIALSIAAQLVQQRQSSKKSVVDGPIPVKQDATN